MKKRMGDKAVQENKKKIHSDNFTRVVLKSLSKIAVRNANLDWKSNNNE